jgi:hypothetical protein
LNSGFLAQAFDETIRPVARGDIRGWPIWAANGVHALWNHRSDASLRLPGAGLSRLRQPTGAGLCELIEKGCGGLAVASEILELVRRNLPELNEARARVHAITVERNAPLAWWHRFANEMSGRRCRCIAGQRFCIP